MPDKHETARRLAELHFLLEPGITRIYRLEGVDGVESSPEEPVKLLEVNEETIPSGILPLGFDAIPEQGVDYPTIIIEVTPEEFEDLRHGRLSLPRGWQIAEELPRPSSVSVP